MKVQLLRQEKLCVKAAGSARSRPWKRGAVARTSEYGAFAGTATAASCLHYNRRETQRARKVPKPRPSSVATKDKRSVKDHRKISLSSSSEVDSAVGTSMSERVLQAPGGHLRDRFTKVYKFGGSSVASAERMREIANIMCLFENEAPVVVLSAMGKTTNNLILAGEAAVNSKASDIPTLEPLLAIKALHEKTMAELDIDEQSRRQVDEHLHELEQLLVGISLLKDLSPRSLDSLVSFGERMSTRIFSGYLRRMGIPSIQHDAFELGFKTTDQFTNGDILYEESIDEVRKNVQRLRPRGEIYGEKGPAGGETETDELLPVLPVVTGFLGQGEKTGAITTLGRGGSDLTATFLGLSLGIEEVIVWKDVDGVLTSDPRICPSARPVPFLTVDEATELAYFGATVLHPQSMQPLLKWADFTQKDSASGASGNLQVCVKNSYNPSAPGSVILAGQRDMSDTLLTSIVLKAGVNMLDISSTRMLGQYGFLAKVFNVFEDLEISVDVVATSEVSVSVTLDISKIWARDLRDEELEKLEESFEGIGNVGLKTSRSIISLIGNADRSNEILAKTFGVLGELDVTPEMISKGAFKNNIALIVPEEEGPRCLKRLHEEFFG
jgi:aspartate kinase